MVANAVARAFKDKNVFERNDGKGKAQLKESNVDNNEDSIINVTSGSWTSSGCLETSAVDSFT